MYSLSGRGSVVNGRNRVRANKRHSVSDIGSLDWAPTDYDCLYPGGSSRRLNVPLFVCVVGIVVLAFVGLIWGAAFSTRELGRHLGAVDSADLADPGDDSSASKDTIGSAYIAVAPAIDRVIQSIVAGLMVLPSP